MESGHFAEPLATDQPVISVTKQPIVDDGAIDACQQACMIRVEGGDVGIKLCLDRLGFNVLDGQTGHHHGSRIVLDVAVSKRLVVVHGHEFFAQLVTVRQQKVHHTLMMRLTFGIAEVVGTVQEIVPGFEIVGVVFGVGHGLVVGADLQANAENAFHLEELFVSVDEAAGARGRAQEVVEYASEAVGLGQAHVLELFAVPCGMTKRSDDVASVRFDFHILDRERQS